jgi:mRNA interferase MazF
MLRIGPIDAALLRLTVAPDATNALDVPPQVQANRLLSLPTTRIGAVIGRLSDGEMVELNRLLAVVIGLA